MKETIIKLYNQFRNLILYGLIGGFCAALDFAVYTVSMGERDQYSRRYFHFVCAEPLGQFQGEGQSGGTFSFVLYGRISGVGYQRTDAVSDGDSRRDE